MGGTPFGPEGLSKKMVRETRRDRATYLDGAGIFAYGSSGSGYEPIDLELTPGVETLDVALYRIESEIEKAFASGIYKQHEDSAAPVRPRRAA